MCRILAFVVLALVGGLCPSRTWAQMSNTSGGVPSLFGNRTMGSARGPSAGTLGTGGGTQGQSELLSGSLLGGSERFVRGNEQSRFVGRDATSVSDMFNSLTGGATSESANRRGQTGRGGRDAARGRQATNQQQRAGGGDRRQATVRAEWQVAFAHPERAPAELSADLKVRLARSLRFRPGSVAEVELENRTVTLRGVVASEHDRILAEKLALLEPGVSRVQNELRVAAASESRTAPDGR